MFDERSSPVQAPPETHAATRALAVCTRRTGLHRSLFVQLSAAQANGSALCPDMHSQLASRHGGSEQRLCLLDAWRESPVRGDRCRAVPAWTESLTVGAA